MLQTHNDGDCDVQQPAAGLVQLAVDRWSMRGLRGDNISAIVVMFGQADDLTTEVPNDEIPQTYEPATSSYSTAGTHRYCRSKPLTLRAAIHKRWRLHPAKRLLARARGIRVPMESFQRLQTPSPSAESHTIDSSDEQLENAQSSPNL